MAFKFSIIFLFLFFLSSFLFGQEIVVELIEPQNGLYINYTPITFSFILKNNTPLEEENLTFDPTNISCFIQFQVDGKIINKGPLYLPIGQKGEFEFKTFPYNTYIWRVNCLSFSSEPRLLIVRNESYNDFLKEFEKQKENQTNEQENNKQNQVIESTKSTYQQSFNQQSYIIILLILFFVFILLYFFQIKKPKNSSNVKTEK
ncbi:MAG: hypothetical protein ACK4J0_02130 [Candidatus Anstonellaceae archaeon]